MRRWVIGVGVVVGLAAGAVVVGTILASDDTTDADLTATAQDSDPGSGSPFTCPDQSGFAAIGIPSPEDLALGVGATFPSLDLRTALAGVPEEYLFGEPELELVAAAILCSLSDGDISPAGAAETPKLVMAAWGSTDVAASAFSSPGGAIVAQGEGGVEGGYNPETERWEWSVSKKISSESSNPDAEGARFGADLEWTASTPKCWDEEGNADATVHLAGEFSRMSSDGDIDTIEVSSEFTIFFSDGSWASEMQIGAVQKRERDGETTVDWDLPAVLYDENDFAILDAANQVTTGINEVFALTAYIVATGKAYEKSTLEVKSECLDVVLDPSALSLEPGDSSGVVATVLDWKNRPIVVVVSAEAEQGSVDPDVGPTNTDGIWATTYTAPSADFETVTVVFTAQRQAHLARARLRVGPPLETWTLAMTVDVGEDPHLVTFLWDGLFTVNADGEIRGEGIGTVLGTAQCQATGSGGTYTGPVADVEGTFVFEVSGDQILKDGERWFRLDVESGGADVEFSFDDPVCGGLVDIAKDFLDLVPTLPPQYWREGFEIQPSDGFGVTSLAMDPYQLDVDITQLGRDE